MEVGFFRDAAISTRLGKWVFCRDVGFPLQAVAFSSFYLLLCPTLEELKTFTRSGQVLSQSSLPSPSSRWVEV